MARLAEELYPEAFDLPQAPSGPNLLQVAWQRKSLIALGAVVGLVLGSLYYAQRTPVYQSALQVLAVKKRPDVLPIPGEEARYAYYEDFLSSHLVLIRSPLIVSRAVKKHDLGSLQCFAGQGDPTGSIIGALGASRDSKDASGNFTNIFVLSFKGTVPDECRKVLDSVFESYKDFLDETYKNVTDETVTLITKARNELGKELDLRDKEWQAFKLMTPSIWRGKDGDNIHHERLKSIESKRSGYIVRRAEQEGRLRALETAVKQGRSRAELLALISDQSWRLGPASDKGLTATLDEQMLPMMLQEQTLLEDHGPDHPQVIALRKRIQVVRDFHVSRAAARAEAGNQESKGEKAQKQDSVDFYIRSIRYDLEAIKVNEETLTEAFDRENKITMELLKDEMQEEALRSAKARTQQMFDVTLRRLDEMNVVRDFGGYDARVISPAGIGWKVEPRPFPIFSVAIFLGVLSGLGLAYLAEISDKSFRTPEEIRRRLGLQVIGHIPFLKPESAPKEALVNGHLLDPALCTYYRPKSTESEAYRGVRTALYFSTRGEGHKVIQVTSPNKADGKSTLAANLAVCIAQSGRKTVLLDADFRKPRQHKIFGISPKMGLASVITGEAELAESIQETGVPGLFVMACGPVPHNPAEILTSPRFKEVLDTIREQYDFVLVDTPPLLAVTDPCVVAPRVDGVLMVVRVSKNGRPYAERAKEILSSLGANVLGVVVNGVGRQAGYAGYGYGNYRYSTYAYGYNYGYGNESYYSETDANGEAEEVQNPANAGDGVNGSPDSHDDESSGEKENGSEGSSQSLFGRLFGRRQT